MLTTHSLIYKSINHTSTGIIATTLNEELMNPIKKLSKKIQKNSKQYRTATDKLVGHIEREYYIDDEDIKSHMDQIIAPMITSHMNTYQYVSRQRTLNRSLPIYQSSVWMNFQKKYEYNPLHMHEGIFSWVLWVDVPYDLEEECNLPHVKNITTTEKSPGAFYYVSADPSFGILQKIIPIDKSMEGTLILFPSNMFHGVYPFFTTDKYRVSMSGNYILYADG